MAVAGNKIWFLDIYSLDEFGNGIIPNFWLLIYFGDISLIILSHTLKNAIYITIQTYQS